MLMILGLAVHLLLPQIAALQNSWQVLAAMAYWAVGLAFTAQVISYLGSGYMLQSILRIANHYVPLWRTALIVLGSTSIGMVAGGTVGVTTAIYRWTSGGKGSMQGATMASIFLPQINNIILVLVSTFGLVHLILTHSLTRAQSIGYGATLLILGLIIGSLALAVRYRKQSIQAVVWVASRVTRLGRKSFDPTNTQREANHLFEAWDLLLQGAWRRPAIGAGLNVTFDMLTLYFVFLAAGEKISPGVLLAGYGLPLLLGKVAFILPGGVGVVETSMAALYTGLGIPHATAVIVVLGYRLISFWIPSLAGFPIAAYLERSLGKDAQKTEVQESVE